MSRATATRTAPKARLKRAVGHRHARLLRACAASWASLSKRGRKSGFSPGAASDCGPLTLTLKQPRMQIALRPTSSQQIPLAIDWRKVSLTRRKMTEKVVASAFMMRLLHRSVRGLPASASMSPPPRPFAGEVGQRPVEGDLAAAKHGHLVAEPADVGHAVRNEDRRLALGLAAKDDFVEQLAGREIHAFGRLVEHQQLGIVDQGLGQGQPLEHALAVGRRSLRRRGRPGRLRPAAAGSAAASSRRGSSDRAP